MLRYYLPASGLFIVLVGLPLLSGGRADLSLSPLLWGAVAAAAGLGAARRPDDTSLHTLLLLAFTVVLAGLRLLEGQ